jgi:hypothetical protein
MLTCQGSRTPPSSPAYEWFGNFGTTAATVTYDLGSVESFDRVALWNEESSGIGLLDLLTSLDGITYTSLVSGLTPTDHPLADYSADVFSVGRNGTLRAF